MRPRYTAPTVSAICNLLGSFSLFWGHFDVKNYASALYRAQNIRDPLFVWIFFLYFLGTNGRHRMSELYRFPQSIGLRYNSAVVI